MAATDVLKRAPKWAWFTVGGVGLGAIAIRLYNGRDADPEDVENTPEGGVQGSEQWQTPGGGASGVIVPPVIIPQTGDPLAGVSELQALYLGAVDSLIGEWGDVYGPIAGLLPTLIPTPGDYMGLITAGADIAQRTPVISVQPVPQQAPAPAPAPGPAAPAPAAVTVTKTCGKSYNGQDNNCRYEKRVHYSNGTSVVVDDHKMHNGKCAQQKTDCW